VCALNNTKTPQQVMSFFVLFLYRIFHFLHFLFKKAYLSWHHQTNKDRTGLPRRFQSTSWYFSECVLVIIVLFCRLLFVFCFRVLSLSRSSSSSSS